VRQTEGTASCEVVTEPSSPNSLRNGCSAVNSRVLSVSWNEKMEVSCRLCEHSVRTVSSFLFNVDLCGLAVRVPGC
jgi:hypothetical protein